MFSKFLHKSNIHMKKLEKLAAIVGLEAKDLTQDQIDAINTEFESNQIQLQVASIGTLESLNQQISQLTTRAEQAENDLSEAQTELTTAQGELQTAQDRIAELEEEAGGESTGSAGKDRKSGGGQANGLDDLSKSILSKYDL